MNNQLILQGSKQIPNVSSTGLGLSTSQLPVKKEKMKGREEKEF